MHSDDIPTSLQVHVEVLENVKLHNFLSTDRAMTSMRLGLKKTKSGKSHWTTDDENIIHEGRIGCGSVGDVHRVLSLQICVAIVHTNHRCTILPSKMYVTSLPI